MSKIHITLVGGQTAPVYLGILDANPDRVVLIHSDQTMDEANRIYSEISIDTELRKFDPVDLNDIHRKVETCASDFASAEQISINISGGTKPWSIEFYHVFNKLSNASIVYIDQNNRIWNMRSRKSKQVSFDMDMQFRLYGNALTEFIKFDDYTIEDKISCAEIRKLYQFNSYDFMNLSKTLAEQADEDKVVLFGASQLHWLKPFTKLYIELKNKAGKTLTKTLESAHLSQLMYNTGWFEFEIAVMLSGWKYAKELRLNCIFPTTDGSPKNEVDIIVNTGTKLLFVECKTKIYNETDIDKFASAVKVYGGLGSKALFITDVAMSDKALEKCNDNGIMTLSLANNLWRVPANKLLFEMLDKELFNINAK